MPCSLFTDRQTLKWMQGTPFQDFRNVSFNLSSRISQIGTINLKKSKQVTVVQLNKRQLQWGIHQLLIFWGGGCPSTVHTPTPLPLFPFAGVCQPIKSNEHYLLVRSMDTSSLPSTRREIFSIITLLGFFSSEKMQNMYVIRRKMMQNTKCSTLSNYANHNSFNLDRSSFRHS